MGRFSSLYICVLAALLPLPATALAAADFDPYSATIEENISTPKVKASERHKLVEAMGTLEKALRTSGYDVRRVRGGEVVLVTIPASLLFEANATTLKAQAAKRLEALVPYVKREDNYKVVVAVHTDGSGDDEYNDELSATRAEAIDAYFATRTGAKPDEGIITYGLGADEPVAPNIGVNNRSRNRRAEIYFIPTSTLIDKLQKR